MSNENGVGRPKFFSDPEKMQEKIDDYFDTVVTPRKPPTIAGLSYHLGFQDRHTLTEYAKYPEFAATVKRCKLRVEEFLETQLLRDGQVTGPIFNLKNNFGWKDKSEIDIGEKPPAKELKDFYSGFEDGKS